MQPVITFTILLWGLALIGAQPLNMDPSAERKSEQRENSKEPNRNRMEVPALIETTTDLWPSTDPHRNNGTDENTTEQLPIGFEQRLSAKLLKVLTMLG